MPPKQLPETDPTNLSGGLVPNRTSVPNPQTETVRSDPEAGLPPHHDVNTVEGLDDPDAEAKAPGRTTHGATNNP